LAFSARIEISKHVLLLNNTKWRSKETLDRLILLDDSIRVVLPDKQYEEDINTCEDYIDKTKRGNKEG